LVLAGGLNAEAQNAAVASSQFPQVSDEQRVPPLAAQGYFFVAGNYVSATDGQIMADQMYVEYQIPRDLDHPYPIVMIHGGGQTGTNFEGTPDGRPGWRNFFLGRGYAVYIIDQPGRARSAYHPDVYGPTNRSTVLTIEQRFTAPELFNLWPQAHLHTQWPGQGPGKGQAGDPIFDQFYASQVESIANGPETEVLNKNADGALLDEIGPAIILTHSQSGPFGWQIGDARPTLVKGIVAVEPGGPPFFDVNLLGPPTYFSDGSESRPWGITATQITYSPPVSDPSQLSFVQQTVPDSPDLVRCRMQTEPVHQLSSIQGIPILMITSQASYHAAYDHCTSKYLTQAGVKHTYVRLPDAGIYGNGHMMMLEKNNLEIAQLIAKWTDRLH
jgi:pimeloyl-ACP methyl ester carboxylesterase